MGCDSCSNSKGGIPGGCKSHGLCVSGGCSKLEVYDWLSDIELPQGLSPYEIVEVRFKNGRKLFYRNTNKIPLYTGDVVAVEVSPGYDVGVVTITGELVRLQMKKKEIPEDSTDIKKIYRKAKPEDIDKWREARGLEEETMHRARKMALNLGLEMKISDVEYQGDKTKATFYYTAEGRVDFRELIKVMAEQFKIRVEMRQIGARQESGRLGGIGSCGRELCCATWLTDFRSVSTGAARYQQLSLNPQKLAGQCGKLKCCLNYELDMYVEAYKEFPDSNIKLQTKKGNGIHQKTDIFKKTMWYTIEGEMMSDFIGLKIDRIKEIIELNKKGIIVDDLHGFKEYVPVQKELGYENVVGQDALTRFDDKNKNRNKGHFKGGQGNKSGQGNKTNWKPKGQFHGGKNKPQHQQNKPNPNNQNRPNPNANKPKPDNQNLPKK